MLARSVLCAALGLLIASVVVFLFGHRIRRSHWILSLSAVMLLGWASWGVQNLLASPPLPLGTVLIAALAAGAAVTAAFERWNFLGHALFTAVLLSVGLFLSYAGYVLFAALLGPWSLSFGILLLLFEIGALALLVAHTFEILDVVCRTRWRRVADAKIVPGYLPKVSLHVPTHCEPPELVIETLNALARLDYPDYEVLVIDNNTTDESLWRPVEEHCADLGPRFRFFHLTPWPGYKSGALNFALRETAEDAEIVGVVDADYLVEPGYLSDLVGHFADPEIAFVQTPQDYRDVADRGIYGKALSLAYLYFFRISMASRNEKNGIIFAGTMGLIRRSALESVGGWDEWCITEDAEVSLRLLDSGYQSVYVERSYGRGIMPLDYAGLKKQRFRWAFGGMQILRMHARRLLSPWSRGRLTAAQRWAYLSGGLQWLNDPLALAFTLILLVGAGALLLKRSLVLQPLVGAAVFIPLLFVLFAVLRFLWALRVRVSSSWRESLYALVVLLGLTWVVTLACLRGLLSARGVFLRTPKQGQQPTLVATLRVVVWEFWLGILCFVPAVLLAVARPAGLFSARGVVVALLFWQSAIYFCAVITALWSYQERRTQPVPLRLSFRTVGPRWGRFVPERQTAAWVAIAAALLAGVFYVAQRQSPASERIMRADPFDQFLHASSVLPPSPEERVGAVLVREAVAARRADIASALALWDPDGVIRDANHTPHVAEDDRIWSGLDGLRSRYRREFGERRYVSLWHLNPTINVSGERAVIINDLDAVFSSERKLQRVRLPRSDRWVLREDGGRWRIVRLDVNRAARRSRAEEAAEAEP